MCQPIAEQVVVRLLLQGFLEMIDGESSLLVQEREVTLYPIRRMGTFRESLRLPQEVEGRVSASCRRRQLGEAGGCLPFRQAILLQFHIAELGFQRVYGDGQSVLTYVPVEFAVERSQVKAAPEGGDGIFRLQGADPGPPGLAHFGILVEHEIVHQGPGLGVENVRLEGVVISDLVLLHCHQSLERDPGLFPHHPDVVKTWIAQGDPLAADAEGGEELGQAFLQPDRSFAIPRQEVGVFVEDGAQCLLGGACGDEGDDRLGVCDREEASQLGGLAADQGAEWPE
ncbi:MAG: hypothetical protein Kow001_03550 [Acidobacteriota bacterium]